MDDITDQDHVAPDWRNAVEMLRAAGYIRPAKVIESFAAEIERLQLALQNHGCHEARHMALIFGEMVEVYLCDHPAVKGQPEWLALADKASETLFDLYQAIGREHLVK